MSNPKASSEVRAGFLITISLVVFIALLFTAGNVQLFQNTREVPVLFNYIGGLEKNAPVRLAGYKIGKVSDIRFSNHPERKVLVTLSVDKNATLKKDSQVFIDIMGFMGEMFVELTPGSPNVEVLPEKQPLEGTDPVPMMKVVKEGTELLHEFEKTQDSLQKMVEELNGIVGENKPNVDKTFQNLNETSENLKEMTHDLKLHPWKLFRKSSDKKKHFLFV